MTDFLDDIKEESYSDALTSGNLKPKERVPFERFHSTGYSAAIHVCLCTGCGTISKTLGGIFHREEGDQGSVRSIALHQGMTLNIPLDPGKRIDYLGSRVKYCAHCVASYGFEHNEDYLQRVIASHE